MADEEPKVEEGERSKPTKEYIGVCLCMLRLKCHDVDVYCCFFFFFLYKNIKYDEFCLSTISC